MKSPFRKKVFSIDLYQNSGRFKIIILVVSVVIGAGSIYATNVIVKRLKEREQRYVELLAKALEFITLESNSDNLTFISQEIVAPNNDIPVILADGLDNIIDSRNIQVDSSASIATRNRILKRELVEMQEQHPPIELAFLDDQGEVEYYHYIYYKNSELLNRLKYYPYIQLSVIAIFSILAYLVFNYSRVAEQNRLWVGLAKETAHQLGTPLSSLMAWTEYLRYEEQPDKSMLGELEKDIQKLQMITERFSNIGSVPVLEEQNIVDLIRETILYLQKRISTKVKVTIDAAEDTINAKINRPLFEWVIENLCKNSVDAMSGVGKLHIAIQKDEEGHTLIDFEDNGKGIHKSKLKTIFQAGFTTKVRGWGLGLTLAKRIIENYHRGKIFVKSSEVDKGTTFRIILKD